MHGSSVPQGALFPGVVFLFVFKINIWRYCEVTTAAAHAGGGCSHQLLVSHPVLLKLSIVPELCTQCDVEMAQRNHVSDKPPVL